MLFITFPSKFNITNTLPAALQLRLFTCHPSPGLRWRAGAALRFARAVALAACEPTFPSPPQWQLSSFLLGSAVLFSQPAWPSRGWWVTHSALVLLYCFLHWPRCVSWPLIGVLVYEFLLFIVFSTPRCLLFLLPLYSLCSCYTLCSAVPYSHSIALFHVPNDFSSLFEKCLLKTHCLYIKEWNKDELTWLGEPGKYPSSSDESGLSWALIFQNSWISSSAVMLSF